jgi:hypothetical protein
MCYNILHVVYGKVRHSTQFRGHSKAEPLLWGDNTGASHPKEVSLSLYKPFSFNEQEEPALPYNLLKNMHPSTTPPPKQ